MNNQLTLNEPDFTVVSRPLVEYIKIQLPETDEFAAQLLAARLIVCLPKLFAAKPEILSQAIAIASKSPVPNTQ